jgi:adenosylcobinamide hydrolase
VDHQPFFVSERRLLMDWFHRASCPISWTVHPEMLMIESKRPLKVLTSAVYGSDRFSCKRMINRHVGRDYAAKEPEEEIRDWLTRKKIPLDETVVLMTAARVDRVCRRFVEEKTFKMAVFVTAGVGNAARAGESYPVFWNDQEYMPHTINTVIVIDGRMTQAAMVNAVITATEAKAAALQDLKVKDARGNPATGTTTDAILIASTQDPARKDLHAYAGLSSPLGSALGKAVYQAVKEAVLAERYGEESI